MAEMLAESRSTEAAAPISTPLVTVIMPVYNEADFIARSLGAVLAQDYPAEALEILIADGLSTDGTRQIIAQIAQQQPHLPIHIVDNPQRIVPTGMNAAIKQAHGEIILRVDGHCEIAPDYIRTCVHLLQTSEAAGVGGPIETIGGSEIGKAIAGAMSSRFGVGGSAFRTEKEKELWVDTIAFPAYRRSTIDQVGPYDEELVRNQDDEYNYRLRKMGGKLLLSPLLQSRYYSRNTLKSVWRQYFQYGYWKVRVMQKHPRQISPRQMVPPLFVASLLGALGLSVFSRWGRRLLALVVGSYAAANLAASIQLARKTNVRYGLYLPIIFSIVHVGYGLGFLRGLVRFRRRWGDTATKANDSSGTTSRLA